MDGVGWLTCDRPTIQSGRPQEFSGIVGETSRSLVGFTIVLRFRLARLAAEDPEQAKSVVVAAGPLGRRFGIGILYDPNRMSYHHAVDAGTGHATTSTFSCRAPSTTVSPVI